MTDFFVFLYPLVSLIALIGYCPQIVRIIQAKTPCNSVSLVTWYVWTLAWVISLGYGMFHLFDVMFIVTAGVNLTAHAGIIFLVMYKRTKYKQGMINI